MGLILSSLTYRVLTIAFKGLESVVYVSVSTYLLRVLTTVNSRRRGLIQMLTVQVTGANRIILYGIVAKSHVAWLLEKIERGREGNAFKNAFLYKRSKLFLFLLRVIF